MRKRLISLVLCVSLIMAFGLSAAYACSSCYEDSQWYPAACVCTADDGAFIRPHHNFNGPIGGVAYAGDYGNTAYLHGSIYDKPNSWYWVSFSHGNAQGLHGWVSAQYIATESD